MGFILILDFVFIILKDVLVFLLHRQFLKPQYYLDGFWDSYEWIILPLSSAQQPTLWLHMCNLAHLFQLP